jgi:hypothetical protein
MMTSTRLLAASLVVLITGCGGGGGGGGGGGSTSPIGNTPSTLSFPAQTAYGSRVAAGSDDNFSIGGTCTGTAKITNGAATTSTFEGVSGLAAAQTATVNFSNCFPAQSTASGTNYYDSTSTPLGSTVAGLEYSKFVSAPTPLPASVMVGANGTIATLTTYSDSSKATVTGQRVLSYVIEPDTADTAILNITTRTYDNSAMPQLLLTQQNKYRLSSGGTLTLLVIDVQYGGTTGAHLIYTKV